MQVILEITRRRDAASEPYIQRIVYSFDDPAATVASALLDIGRGEHRDESGAPVEPIRWECSCLQKKCGACAMVISSRPMLACDAKLSEKAVKGVVTVEPLRKFPVVADLIVDRAAMFEALERLTLWLREERTVPEGNLPAAFAASKCLQCGCCLEVCPNFYAGGEFFGTAGAVPLSRLLASGSRGELSAAYRKHIYEGCGKSLACRNICPAGIDIDSLLVNSAAAAVWKRRFGKAR